MKKEKAQREGIALRNKATADTKLAVEFILQKTKIVIPIYPKFAKRNLLVKRA